MSAHPKGPIIQIDRLIFDTRYEIKRKPILPDGSPSSTIVNFLTNSSKEDDSHFFFSSDQIRIIRLTLDDLKKRIPKSTPVENKTEPIRSPVYESIDERRNQPVEQSY